MRESKQTILVVEDSRELLGSLEVGLSQDYQVRCARSLSQARARMSPPPDVALLDIVLDESAPDKRDGLVLLKELREQHPQVPVLIMTAYGDIDMAVECMKLGAADFIQKPIQDIAELKTRIARALEHSLLSRRVAQLEQDIKRLDPRELVGNSPKIQEIRRVIEAAGRDGNVTLFLRGETGTGKELVARAVWASGRRKHAPFVAVMVHALPPSMVEVELFGCEAGAYTDAQERRIGYLENAHGGVLFLDEIGDIDAGVQAKLLRFLEEREFQRLGSTTPIRVDLQIVAATNADLEQRTREGKFREDLYYRLKVHEVVLPPLRERSEDIPVIVDHFLKMFRAQGKRVRGISRAALETLQQQAWPGNVRQLKNAVESAIFQAEIHGHERIEVNDLPAGIQACPSHTDHTTQGDAVAPAGRDIEEILARTELSCVDRALQSSGGHKTEAARALGYRDRFALYRKVRRILEKYPELAGEFPRIKTAYASEHSEKTGGS
jgi:DNA-binding NtrC family response regulator